MELSALNVFDAVVLSIILISTALAFMRGFIRTTISLTCWALSVLLSIFMAPYTIRYLEGHVESVPAVALIAYIGGFTVIFTLFAIIFSFITKYARPACDGFVDRSLGAGLGLLRGVLMACLMFVGIMSALKIVTSNQENPDYKGPAWLAEAQTFNFLRLSSSLFEEMVPDDAREWMHKRFNHIGNLASALMPESSARPDSDIPELSAEMQKTLNQIITVLPEDAIDVIDAEYGNVTRKMLSAEEKMDLHAQIVVAYEEALVNGQIISDDRIDPVAVEALKAGIMKILEQIKTKNNVSKGGVLPTPPGATEAPAAYSTEKMQMMQRLVDQFQ